MDRHVDRDRVEVQFFGRRAYFLRTPALLSYLTGRAARALLHRPQRVRAASTSLRKTPSTWTTRLPPRPGRAAGRAAVRRRCSSSTSGGDPNAGISSIPTGRHRRRVIEAPPQALVPSGPRARPSVLPPHNEHVVERRALRCARSIDRQAHGVRVPCTTPHSIESSDAAAIAPGGSPSCDWSGRPSRSATTAPDSPRE